ncbi:MAG: hypothetical protein K1X94_35930 [Sandaracinaceae bacterium]|nr:hypothetical protein [Sandaracinaceae bacterium]
MLPVALVLLGACGGSPPPRTRVQRPCVPLAWIDQGRGSLAVQYRALGDDAWLALDLRSAHTVLYGQDRLASLGVRRGDRHVLAPAIFGSMPHELEVSAEPELPFTGAEGRPGFVVGRLGRESLEDRVVEIDGGRMQMCDRYADEVESVPLRRDDDALAGPFGGQHVLVRVRGGEAQIGAMR